MAPTPCRQPSSRRPLRSAHFRWWCNAFGDRFSAAAAARGPSAADVEQLYVAIRDNNVRGAAQLLKQFPFLTFTKVQYRTALHDTRIGSTLAVFTTDVLLASLDSVSGDACDLRRSSCALEQRTPLYVASFFGRHDIIRLLLSLGADRHLSCGGAEPISVACYGRHDVVDRMKVRCLLQDNTELQVLLCQQGIVDADQDASRPTRMTRYRVHIHFSDAVEDFIQEDVVAEQCDILSFTELQSDFYCLIVRPRSLDHSVQANISLFIPAGAVRRREKTNDGMILTNSASNRLELKTT
ncbi:hypothetical protein PINS_up001296 [Pythium insidiosum]|nr:hypothetical protein PINS_up001296 [Pythium insidiosum]